MDYSAAQLLVDTVAVLSRRAPAIAAAAAHQLGAVVLSIHFGDDSHAELRAQHSCLLPRVHRSEHPDVEAYFDNRSMNLLFDLERRPVDQVLAANEQVLQEGSPELARYAKRMILDAVEKGYLAKGDGS